MSTKTRMVWVTRMVEYREGTRPSLDVSDAKRFGEVCEAFPKDIAPYDIAKQQEIIRGQVIPASSPNDKLLVVGPRIMLIVFTAEWLSYFGRVNLLVFEHNRGQYIEKYIETGMRS